MRFFLVTLLVGDSPLFTSLKGLKVVKSPLRFDQSTHPTCVQIIEQAAIETGIKDYAPFEVISLYEFKSEQEFSEFTATQTYVDAFAKFVNLRELPLFNVSDNRPQFIIKLLSSGEYVIMTNQRVAPVRFSKNGEEATPFVNEEDAHRTAKGYGLGRYAVESVYSDPVKKS